MWHRIAAPNSIISKKTINCSWLRCEYLLIYSIFPPSTLLVSVPGLSHQLGGAGETKTVNKACLIESKRNCFYTAKCLLRKISTIFMPLFISASIILILPFYMFVFVFHPRDLNKSISGGKYAALNCQVR